jgi:hypothetical protein
MAVAGLKLFGFSIPASRRRRPEATAADASEQVAVCLLLDEWCRGSAINQSDPRAYACVERIVALREAGKTIEEVRSEIFTDTRDDVVNTD